MKIFLGGESNSRDLQDLSTLIGERDETTESTTTEATGGRSHQRSIRRVPILSPNALRTILLRAAPLIVTDLRPWTGRKDADQLTADRRQVEQTLRAAA